MAAHSGMQQTVYRLHLRQGARDLSGEDAVASRLLIQAFAEAASIADGARLDLGLRPNGALLPITEELKASLLSL